MNHFFVEDINPQTGFPHGWWMDFLNSLQGKQYFVYCHCMCYSLSFRYLYHFWNKEMVSKQIHIICKFQSMLIATLKFHSQKSICMIGYLIYINANSSSNWCNIKRPVHAIYFAVHCEWEACNFPSQDHDPMKSNDNHSVSVLAGSLAKKKNVIV